MRYTRLFLTALTLTSLLAVGCLPTAVVVTPAPPPPVVQPDPDLSPLHVEGLRFVDGAGQEFRWKGVTDFLLLARYLNGENIEPILQDRVNVGANLVRVFGMLASWGNPATSPSDGIIHFFPQEHADYFDRLRTFLDLLKRYRLRCELVVFADAQIVMPDQGQQLAHWNRVAVSIGDKTNVVLQVVNQGKKNGVDSTVFPNPHDAWPNLLASRDSGMEGDNPPPANGFAYSAYTSSRADIKWFVEQGSSMYYLIYGWGPGTDWAGTHHISILDEPMGASEREQPGKRSADVNAFKQLARSLVWGNGATFHCDDCINSVVLGPVQHSAAVEFLGNLP